MKVILELDDIAMAATLLDAVRAQVATTEGSYNYLRRCKEEGEFADGRKWTPVDQERMAKYFEELGNLNRLLAQVH